MKLSFPLSQMIDQLEIIDKEQIYSSKSNFNQPTVQIQPSKVLNLIDDYFQESYKQTSQVLVNFNLQKSKTETYLEKPSSTICQKYTYFPITQQSYQPQNQSQISSENSQILRQSELIIQKQEQSPLKHKCTGFDDLYFTKITPQDEVPQDVETVDSQLTLTQGLRKYDSLLDSKPKNNLISKSTYQSQQQQNDFSQSQVNSYLKQSMNCQSAMKRKLRK